MWSAPDVHGNRNDYVTSDNSKVRGTKCIASYCYLNKSIWDRDRLSKAAHRTHTTAAWDAFRNVRNRLKRAIRVAREQFVTKALSSKKPKEIWNVIHRILKPSHNPTRFELDSLNKFFVGTAERTLAGNNSPIPFEDLLGVIKNLPQHEDESLTSNLRPVTHHEVFQALKTLRADCSTGPDLIPTRYNNL